MRRITNDQARRFALAAQGFTRAKASGRVDARHFRKVVDTVGLIQLDSVNVFSRAHYMPFFSRLGAYDRASLDRYLWGSGELFEYWAHEASLLPVADHRLFRWRMKTVTWDRLEQIKREHPGYMERVLEQVRTFGPLQTADLDDPGERANEMWGWPKGKVALEALFMAGEVTTASRPNFTRLYDLTDRVISAEHLGPPDLEREDAYRQLLLKAARHLGVGTADDLIDYHRLQRPTGGIKIARAALEKLAERGELIEVEVEGWGKPGYLHPDATLPRSALGTALLSPFDSLVWFRDRAERIWDFYYRIEIYVPERKRVYGYYVLPFLLDGHLVARVDLKTDRKTRRLQVKGSFAEPGRDLRRVGFALKAELERVAAWLDLDEIEVARNGDLAPFVG